MDEDSEMEKSGEEDGDTEYSRRGSAAQAKGIAKEKKRTRHKSQAWGLDFHPGRNADAGTGKTVGGRGRSD